MNSGIPRDAYLRLLLNYIFLIEIALATPFHPYFIYDKVFEWSELYPPLRFIVMVQDMAVNKSSVGVPPLSFQSMAWYVNGQSYTGLHFDSLSCINSHRFIEAADVACSRFRWGSYSGALRKAGDFYERLRRESKTEEHVADIGRFIIDSKRNGTILDLELLKQIPVHQLSTDGAVESITSGEDEAYTALIEHRVNEPFMSDLILNNDYEDTKSAVSDLQRYIPKEMIDNLLQEKGYASYIDKGIHLSPFVDQQDMIDNFNGKIFD